MEILKDAWCLSSSWYNEISQSGLNSKDLFLTILEAGKSETGVPAALGSNESSHPAL